MLPLLRTGAALLAASSLALMPVEASAETKDYDPAMYDLLLDCAAVYIVVGQASDKDAEKEKATNSAVGFISGAESLSGVEITDYAAVLNPRKDKLLEWLRKKDPSLARTMRSCVAIEKVGTSIAMLGK